MKNSKKFNNIESSNIAKNDSIQLALLYRSLYILKKKFSKFKSEINNIYNRYYGGDKLTSKSNDHHFIKVYNFFNLVYDVFKEIKITIPKFNAPIDVFNFDIKNFDYNCDAHKNTIKLLEKMIFNKFELEKYNRIYYEKKIKPLKDSYIKNKNSDVVSNCFKIVEYNRKGKIIHTCEELFLMCGIKGGYQELTKDPEEEFNEIVKKGYFLYIDTLPLIIADFLQKNLDYVLIDLDIHDFEMIKEIRKLFDEPLLKEINDRIILKPEEYKSRLNDLKERKAKLEKTLQLYQNLLKTKKDNPFIIKFINQLKEEIEKINQEMSRNSEKLQNVIQKDNNMNKIDQRIKEIYLFYCSQHRAQAAYPTFSQISYKSEHMNISELLKFCKDFNIYIFKNQIFELYSKKNSDVNDFINYKQFLDILKKISEIFYKNKKDDLEFKLAQKTYKNMLIKEKILKELEHLKKLTPEQKYEELKKHLELNDPIKYRDKLKGFINTYYDITEKIEIYDPLNRKEISEIRKNCESFRKKRENIKNERINIENKKKDILYKIEKEKFIHRNKILMQRMEDKEGEKKKYEFGILKKIKKKEDEKYIIDKNTKIENLNFDLTNEQKKQLDLNDNESNSDDGIFNSKKNVSKRNDINKISNANTENISEMHISNYNDSIEIKLLKHNLNPVNKENRYLSLNLNSDIENENDNNNEDNINIKEAILNSMDVSSEIKDSKINRNLKSGKIYLTEPNADKVGSKFQSSGKNMKSLVNSKNFSIKKNYLKADNNINVIKSNTNLSNNNKPSYINHKVSFRNNNSMENNRSKEIVNQKSESIIELPPLNKNSAAFNRHQFNKSTKKINKVNFVVNDNDNIIYLPKLQRNRFNSNIKPPNSLKLSLQ